MTPDPRPGAAPADAHEPGQFVEVADRVWVARHAWFDLNVTVVGSDSGLLVIDTHASERAARVMLGQLQALRLGPTRGRVLGVVNTHEHFDHTFGNAVFRDLDAGVAIHAHENADVVSAGERIKREYRATPDEHTDEVLESRLVVPDRTFSSVAVIELGDRRVELIHPGRGHTDGDLVAHVPDADLMVLGDLVEESAPPGFGADSYPLEWPATLDLILGLMGPDTVGVPGHGAVVGREFVAEQQAGIAAVAQQVANLAGAGVPLNQVLATGAWPYPVEVLDQAVARAWEHLPRGSRQLPRA